MAAPPYATLLGGLNTWPRSSDPFSARISQAAQGKWEQSPNVYNNGAMPEFAPQMVTTPQLLTSHLKVPSASVRTRAPVVSRIPRMNGLEYMYSYGAVNMGGSPKIPHTVDSGVVNSTQFQPLLQALHFYAKNLKWYTVYPNGAAVFQGSNPVRYQYYSMKVPQINTRTSGGPGPIGVRMQPKPRWSSVQKVQRAVAAVRYYATQASNQGVLQHSGGSSTVGRVQQ